VSGKRRYAADRKNEQKMIKKTATFLLIAFLFIFIYGCGSGGARPGGNTRERILYTKTILYFERIEKTIELIKD